MSDQMCAQDEARRFLLGPMLGLYGDGPAGREVKLAEKHTCRDLEESQNLNTTTVNMNISCTFFLLDLLF